MKRLLFLTNIEWFALGIVESIVGLDAHESRDAERQDEREQERRRDRHPDAAREEALTVVHLTERVVRAGHVASLQLFIYSHWYIFNQID